MENDMKQTGWKDAPGTRGDIALLGVLVECKSGMALGQPRAAVLLAQVDVHVRVETDRQSRTVKLGHCK